VVEGFSGFSNVIELLDHGIDAKFWAKSESHVGTPEKARSTAVQLVSVIETR
jgi:hypothetical protein